jgi:hypothetical protein
MIHMLLTGRAVRRCLTYDTANWTCGTQMLDL